MVIVEPLVILVVAVILLWLLFWILGQFPLGEPFDRIVRVIGVIIAVVILIWVILRVFGVAIPHSAY